MDASQGVEMSRAVRPKLSIPIHYDDYTVFKSPPLGDFQSEVKRAGPMDQVQYLQRGETFSFALDLPMYPRARTGLVHWTCERGGSASTLPQ
jgi:L-ascorbate metabolism protein UlaG (beta-lactamase superfamily)